MAKRKEQYGPDYEQPTSIPMLTEAYNLPAKRVIHVVGPIVSGALTRRQEQELAACYENGLRSVAFCCISTGVFRFPKQRAAELATETVTGWRSAHPGGMDRVIFNVFQESDRACYEALLR